MSTSLRYPFLWLLFSYSSYATAASYLDDIGLNRLANELGQNLPEGNNVIVLQAEAATNAYNDPPYPPPVCLPNPTDPAFAGKSIINETGASTTEFSGHATGVGRLLYGNNSIAPGITEIHAYLADYWISAGYLNYGSTIKPLISPARLGNHSWVANVTDSNVASNILRRIDWVTDRDEFLQIVGTRNANGLNNNLCSAAYNVLAVGRTDGHHSTGSAAIDSVYVAGRMKTEIVAPRTTTSSATPVVASTAALLVETGHSDTGLSTDPQINSTLNRNGDRIYNAERSEVIKAALLAGADRHTRNFSTTANIIDYRATTTNQSANGLDTRYGAGQVNVYNSYHIIAGGEQNSNQDGGAGSGSINEAGFDYDPNFGGGNGSNTTASYTFTTGTTPKVLSASLVWNLAINGGNGTFFSGTPGYYDLDLALYDGTGQTLIFKSDSLIDNTENIHLSLAAGNNYLLKVTRGSGQSSFNRDYALAWILLSDQDGDGVEDTVDAFPQYALESTDTDGDGIGNNEDTDDDNDLLSDAEEAALGTSPLLADTDGDGYSDYDEVNTGSDPLNKNNVPTVADGDLNSDGMVDVRDNLLAMQILMGQVPLTSYHLLRGDVAPLVSGTPQPDGAFNAGDLVVLQQKILGIINF